MIFEDSRSSDTEVCPRLVFANRTRIGVDEPALSRANSDFEGFLNAFDLNISFASSKDFFSEQYKRDFLLMGIY